MTLSAKKIHLIFMIFCMQKAFASECMINPVLAYQHITGMHVKDNQMTNRQTNQNININTANVATLIQLPNIGIKKAQAIIDYRNQHGHFTNIEDLTKVKGIGKKTLNKFKHRLAIQ